MYVAGCAKQVEKRLPGSCVQSMACVLLLIGAIAGLILSYTGA
jgi:hypothetical protein